MNVDREEPMNVGIVGGNSQVATELAVLLEREDDVTVTPIVRNSMGTHFLSRCGFDCRVFDVSDPSEAETALADVDVVVVAAFAWQYSNEGFQSRKARHTNESLVRNSIEQSSTGTPVIYFSSLAAFGDDLGAPSHSDWSLYTREKRNAERVLAETCERHGEPGYALRLGNVHGANQENTADLVAEVADSDRVDVATDPDKPSNALHTVTLCEGVLRCATGDVEPGRYSLVNEPQWTWRELIEYYADPGASVAFHPPYDDADIPKAALRKGWELAENRESTLRTFTVFVPDSINQWLFYKYLTFQRGGEIGNLERETWVQRNTFAFDPIPGPFVTGLTETHRVLERESVLEKVFSPT